MKFTFEIEVEAPENKNKDYPREIHALEWIHDVFKKSICMCIEHKANHIITLKGKVREGDYFMKEMNNEIAAISDMSKTIRVRRNKKV